MSCMREKKMQGSTVELLAAALPALGKKAGMWPGRSSDGSKLFVTLSHTSTQHHASWDELVHRRHRLLGRELE